MQSMIDCLSDQGSQLLVLIALLTIDQIIVHRSQIINLLFSLTKNIDFALINGKTIDYLFDSLKSYIF